MKRERFLVAANVVSLSRLFLAALFVALAGARIRFFLLVLSAITDFLDGWLARRSKLESRSGALVDAVADRIFALTATSVLFLDDYLSIWFAIILLSRDIMTAIGFIVARIIPWLRSVAFKARFVGKTVTVLQYITLGAALELPVVVPALIVVVGAISLAAIADYTLALWRARAVV